MKKTLLSILSVVAISFASFAQLDVAITAISVPAPSSTINIGDSIDITFTFGVVADTLHNGDTVTFSITLPGQSPRPVGLIMSQDMTTGLAAQISLQQKLPTSAIAAGTGDICIEFSGVGLTPGDANAANNKFCATYTWQTPITTPSAIEENYLTSNLYIANSNFVYDINTNEPISFLVYNTAGRLVKATNSNISNGSIDFSDLNNGIYIVNIQVGNKVISKKVAKF